MASSNDRADRMAVTTPRRDLEELDLYHRICARDEDALLECFDRFAPVVYCLLKQLTPEVSLIEDLTVRTFVSLWREPASFDPRRGPMALQLLATLPASLPGGAPASGGVAAPTPQLTTVLSETHPHGGPGPGAFPRAWPAPGRWGWRGPRRSGPPSASAARACSPPTGRPSRGAPKPCAR